MEAGEVAKASQGAGGGGPVASLTTEASSTSGRLRQANGRGECPVVDRPGRQREAVLTFQQVEKTAESG